METLRLAHLNNYHVFLLSLAMTLVLGGLIAVLTLAPISSPDVPGSDKLYHVLACAALSFPLPFARPRFMIPVALAVVVYAGLIELIQPYVGRSGEWADLFADAAGAIIGAGLGALFGNRLQQYWGTKAARTI